MGSTDQDGSRIAAIATLSDPSRRELYEFVRREGRPVNREEAAQAVGISRKLAAFHLDRLVAAGLLLAGSARVAGSTRADGTRRVGRSPKVYQPAPDDVTISIPPRRHDLLADILLEAVLTEHTDESAREAALRAAQEQGRRLGAAELAQVRRTDRARLGGGRTLSLAERILSEHGFEPDELPGSCLRLLNCPFHPLVRKSPELVCAINHAFVSGLLHGLGTGAVRAILEPQPDQCCVRLQTGQQSE